MGIERPRDPRGSVPRGDRAADGQRNRVEHGDAVTSRVGDVDDVLGLVHRQDSGRPVADANGSLDLVGERVEDGQRSVALVRDQTDDARHHGARGRRQSDGVERDRAGRGADVNRRDDLAGLSGDERDRVAVAVGYVDTAVDVVDVRSDGRGMFADLDLPNDRMFFYVDFRDVVVAGVGDVEHALTKAEGVGRFSNRDRGLEAPETSVNDRDAVASGVGDVDLRVDYQHRRRAHADPDRAADPAGREIQLRDGSVAGVGDVRARGHEDRRPNRIGVTCLREPEQRQEGERGNHHESAHDRTAFSGNAAHPSAAYRAR